MMRARQDEGQKHFMSSYSVKLILNLEVSLSTR